MKDMNLSRRAIMLGAATLPLAQNRLRNHAPSVGDLERQRLRGLRQSHGTHQSRRGHARRRDRGREHRGAGSRRDHSVGYGGLPNEDGVVELDASCMHGPSRRGGAVGALRGIKTPSKVAKLVMEQTDHMFLVGEGALRFAKAMGMKEEELLTEESRQAWMVWKRSLRDPGGHTNWGPGLDAPPEKKKAGLDLEQLKKEFPQVGEAVAGRVPGVCGQPAARYDQLHRR